jgi:hypothetical protein
MTDHDEIQDLLEAFVDETLDRPTRQMVDHHLKDCEMCRALLDDVAPVDLGTLSLASDERTLRRSVRRAMRRTILDATLTLLVVWLAGWLLAAMVVQPLVVDRGDREVAAAQATIDLAVMTNPGAWVTDFNTDSTGWKKTFTVEAGLEVGSGMKPLGEFTSRLGPIGFGNAQRGRLFPGMLSPESRGSLDTLTGLGEGTVATVYFAFEDRLSIDEAQAVADSTTDTRVIWVGFAGNTLGDREYGYGTCLNPDEDPMSGFRGQGFFPASISGAHAQVERALANLVEHPEIARVIIGLDSEAEDALDYIESNGEVARLVVTGPTGELVQLVEELGRPPGEVLAVDFYNWSVPVCGR